MMSLIPNGEISNWNSILNFPIEGLPCKLGSQIFSDEHGLPESSIS